MARSLSIKVPTSTIIAEIEKAIAEIDKAVASYPADFEKYEKASEIYKKKVAKFIADYLAKNANKIGYNYDSDIRLTVAHSSRIELVIDASKIADFPEKPVEPKKPNQSEWIGREHTNRKQLLEKNLRLLRMTSQEEVNASTYGAIMELL